MKDQLNIQLQRDKLRDMLREVCEKLNFLLCFPLLPVDAPKVKEVKRTLVKAEKLLNEISANQEK